MDGFVFHLFAPDIVPQPGVSTIIGWMLAVNGLGAFFCTYAGTFLTSVLKVSSLKTCALVMQAF